MVSTGDPQRDAFHEYAHRFRVFVPAAWVRSAEDERMVRRAVDAEKPAHTAYELCLVEPRFRVGSSRPSASTRSSRPPRWPSWLAAGPVRDGGRPCLPARVPPRETYGRSQPARVPPPWLRHRPYLLPAP